MRKKVFRVHLTRTVESHVDVVAESEEDAVDMCLVGIGVKENGTLDARSDYEQFVVGKGVQVNNDEEDPENPVEEVTGEYDLAEEEEEEEEEEDAEEEDNDDPSAEEPGVVGSEDDGAQPSK